MQVALLVINSKLTYDGFIRRNRGISGGRKERLRVVVRVKKVDLRGEYFESPRFIEVIGQGPVSLND